jgi:type III restriction enzyme
MPNATRRRKWFRPVKGQFQIFYRKGVEQPEYVPDFVAETATRIYMVETKARGDLADTGVQAKADAAVQWCRHASEYAKDHGGKPWDYLLIPHDEINESRRLRDFERFLKAAAQQL